MLKRDKEIKIRFTELELSKLNKICTKLNIKRERYLREMITNNLSKEYVPREVIVAELKQLILQVDSVGQDIKNIAREIHEAGVSDDDVISQVLNMQRIIFDELRRFKSIK